MTRCKPYNARLSGVPTYKQAYMFTRVMCCVGHEVGMSSEALKKTVALFAKCKNATLNDIMNNSDRWSSVPNRRAEAKRLQRQFSEEFRSAAAGTSPMVEELFAVAFMQIDAWIDSVAWLNETKRANLGITLLPEGVYLQEALLRDVLYLEDYFRKRVVAPGGALHLEQSYESLEVNFKCRAKAKMDKCDPTAATHYNQGIINRARECAHLLVEICGKWAQRPAAPDTTATTRRSEPR
jgi:hypothetical protein